jgi:6-phosphofructokinase 1
LAIKDGLAKYCKQKGMNITLKYIDPSYMVRSIRSNAYDSGYCAYTAQNAVHGCMFGFTGFSNGLVKGKNCLIPLEEMLSSQYNKRIPPNHKLWRRFVLASG